MDSEPTYDTSALKAMGMMKQKAPDLFSIRLRVVGGRLETEHLRVLAQLADAYGDGHVHATTRQGVEIPNVHFDDIARVEAGLTAAGLEFGACGRRVRTVTACQGAICSHGLIDPQSLARSIDARFYGLSGLPHKFKIGIAGCPNGCTKPQENDFGVMGVARKVFHPERCTACGLCVHACPIPGALALEDGQLAYDPEQCVNCANCVGACPTDAWEATGSGYALFVGGKMGKRPKLGARLPLMITDDERLLAAVEATVDWFSREGQDGERFGDTLERTGLETLTEHLHAVAG